MVLAAGIAAHSTFRDFKSLDIPRAVMDVNYMGLLNITKHALPPLRESKG